MHPTTTDIQSVLVIMAAKEARKPSLPKRPSASRTIAPNRDLPSSLFPPIKGPQALAPSHTAVKLNERHMAVQPRRWASHWNRRSAARKAEPRTLPHNGHPPATVSFLTGSRHGHKFTTPAGDGPHSSDHCDWKANNLDEYGPMAKVKNVQLWESTMANWD